MSSRRDGATQSASAPGRPLSRVELEREVRDLRDRLNEAEQTLHAIRNDEIDALVVVTRQHGAEEVLTLGGAHVPYRHFVEAMQDGALTVSDDGTILQANRRFEELTGRGALIGTPLAALFDDAGVLRTLLQNASAESMTASAVLIAADGSHHHVDLSASVLPLADVRRIAIVVTKASANSGLVRIADDASRAAASSAARLESVLSHIPVAILSVDARTGTVAYANRRAEEILGRVLVDAQRPLSHAELTCWRPDGTIVSSDQLPVPRVLRGEWVVREELVRVRSDGTMIPTRTTAVPVKDEDGNVESVLVAFEDATEEAIARAEREANDRFRELFIGMLGHDLRDPLAAVVTGSALLLKRAGLAAEQVRLLERVAGSANRMARMVEQILDFTRSRLGGGIPVYRQPVVLSDVVRSVVDGFESSQPERRIDASYEASSAGDWDPDRLAQVVSNLVGNALTHGTPGLPIRVRVYDRDGTTRLEVHNAGASIPPALVPIIFDPFRRAGVGRGSHGLGLGLYIAQQIVHAHGGTLTVDSAPDRGTTFVVVLPRLAPTSRPRLPSA